MRLNLPQFLFINGPTGSGKTTLTRMICEEHPAAFHESFAQPIRDMIGAVFFPSFVTELPVDLRDQKVKDANLATLANLGESVRSPSPSIREAMIEFSEGYMKKLWGDDIFGRLLHARCAEQTLYYHHFIIDDSGFAAEAQYIISCVDAVSCRLVRLHRLGCDFSGDSRAYISLPDVQTFDLHNNGTPDEMMASLQLELENL